VKKITGYLLVLWLIVIHTPTWSQQKEIIGYYPDWKWKSRNNLVTPGRIPYEKLTIINYAFFYPLPDGNLVGRDTVGDNLYLRGINDPQRTYLQATTPLIELAHRQGVKVMLSIGGWEESYNFPQVAASESKRAQFAHSCLEQIRIYGFDGIDIDWEYPCLTIHEGTPADKYNYTLLLRTTRDSLNVHSKHTGKHYLLTAALPGLPSAAENFEMVTIGEILDLLNVMTYDFNGSWDRLSGLNSPLYPPRADDPIRNVDAALKLYTETYKISAAKINLGVPFYGQTYTRCTSLYSPHGGADTIHFSPQGAFYYDIIQVIDRFTRYWDNQAKVPYLISSSWNTLISYDDAESIGYKAQYVIDHNAGGLIIWEITGDFLSDGSTPLLDVIYSKFHDSGHREK
jgi:chitinase